MLWEYRKFVIVYMHYTGKAVLEVALKWKLFIVISIDWSM